MLSRFLFAGRSTDQCFHLFRFFGDAPLKATKVVVAFLMKRLRSDETLFTDPLFPYPLLLEEKATTLSRTRSSR